MNLRLRSLVTSVHRYLGLTVAGVLMVSGLTGSVIAFESELERWLNPEVYRIAESGQSALSSSELVARIEAFDPRVRVFYMPLPKQPTQPAHALKAYVEAKQNVQTGDYYDIDYDEVFINPVSGVITGKRLWGACCFERINIIPFLYKLHNRLLLPKPWGSRLMGAIALIWIVLIALGFYLTLPRAARPGTAGNGSLFSGWKRSWRVQGGLPLTPKLMQLHRAMGLWLLPFMLLVALSGAAMNLESEMFRPLLNTFSSVTEFEVNRSAPRPVPKPAVSREPISFDVALSYARRAAEQEGIGAAATSISLDVDEHFYSVTFGSSLDIGFDPVEIFIDGLSGEPLGLKRVTDGSRGDVLMALRHSLHTGQIIGLPGRVVSVLIGLMTLSLAAVGVVLWWRRRARG